MTSHPSSKRSTTGRTARGKPWFIAGCVLVALLGLGAGALAGVPGLVERAGERALMRLEERFGVRVSAAEVDWSWGGRLTAKGVSLRASADPEHAVFATAETLEVESEVDVWARRVRLVRVALSRPVLKVTRRADGSSNLDPILAGLSSMRDGTAGGGGLAGGVTIVPELPIVVMDGATLALDAVLPPLPLGLTLPGRATFEEGRVTLRPTGPATDEAVGIATTPVRLEVSFASTSLDPGQGLTFSAEGTLAGAPTRVELRPARPVRFWLQDRVVGVGGIALTAEGVELGPLQLSVPLERQGGTEVAAAASCERVLVTPSPREVLARVQRLGASLTAGGDLRATLGLALSALDQVTVVKPVIALTIDEAGHHDFEDLLPGLTGATLPLAAGARDEVLLVRAVSDASVRASERLFEPQAARTSGSRESAAPLSARLSRPFEAMAQAARREIPALARRVGMKVVKHLVIEGGEVMLALPGAELTLTDLALDATHEGVRSALRVSLGITPRDPALGPPATATLGADADAERLHLELAATQVPLGLLGPVRGALRLGPEGRVERLALTLDSDVKGAVWEVSAKGELVDATFQHPSVASSPLTDLDLQAAGTVRWNGPEGRLSISDAVLQSKGVTVHTTLDIADALHVPKLHLRLDLPETPAQRIADALPRELIPMLAGLRLEGSLGWSVVVDLDSADPAGVKIDSRPEARGVQVLTLGDKIDLAALRIEHTYDILLGDGTPGRRVVGPMTGSWVPLSAITPYLPLALTTTEDGTFYSNDGISTLAMRESIATNLARGSFVRGASTLTQQLVKNLYLGGDKTISRKLQEIFIAWQLTQYLTKDEVMALYLNTIEFGPGLYGIGDAAWHWFGKRPLDLTLTEAIFLASIIPGPRRYYSFLLQGEVTPRWRSYLEALLGVMVERGKITRDEMLAAAPYEPLFRGAGGGYTDSPPPEDFDALPEGDEVDDE